MEKLAEIEFARSFEPGKPRADYEWTVEFAREALAARSAAADALDDKAECLRRYVGTVLVGFSAALLLVLQSHPLWIFSFFPALVALMIAAILSGSVSSPIDFPALPKIERALAYAKRYGAEGEVRFYAFAVSLQTSLDDILEGESRRTKHATYWFIAALSFLLGAIAVVALSLAGVLDLKALLERA